MVDPAVSDPHTSIVTAILKEEHDLLVAIRGRSLTDDAMRCPTSDDNRHLAVERYVEQLMARRLLNNR